MAAIGSVVEPALLGTLALRVDRAQQGATNQVAGNREVIAGREQGGVGGHLDVAAMTEQADVQSLLS